MHRWSELTILTLFRCESTTSHFQSETLQARLFHSFIRAILIYMKVATQNNRVLTIFTPEREGGYMVSFPDYPGCVTFGKTLNEA